MNKKGVELSMNVIIISILVILVLLVLAFFFLGGTSNLFQKIQSIGPDNLETAARDCASKCQLAQTYSSDNLKIKSGYCSTTYNVDSDGDGVSDKKHHCWSDTIGENCPGVKDFCTAEDVEEL
ncbi:hypothetical protein J4406_00560 [Candidatus Woesearchaeota archaeon]|nr:hypothetical protein [Candidatus Woesearchaeota archaeon]